MLQVMYQKIMSAMVAGVIENPQADKLLKQPDVVESLTDKILNKEFK